MRPILTCPILTCPIFTCIDLEIRHRKLHLSEGCFLTIFDALFDLDLSLNLNLIRRDRYFTDLFLLTLFYNTV